MTSALLAHVVMLLFCIGGSILPFNITSRRKTTTTISTFERNNESGSLINALDTNRMATKKAFQFLPYIKLNYETHLKHVVI